MITKLEKSPVASQTTHVADMPPLEVVTEGIPLKEHIEFPAAAQVEPLPEVRQGWGRMWAWALAGVMGLLLVVAGVFAFTSSGNPNVTAGPPVEFNEPMLPYVLPVPPVPPVPSIPSMADISIAPIAPIAPMTELSSMNIPAMSSMNIPAIPDMSIAPIEFPPITSIPATPVASTPVISIPDMTIPDMTIPTIDFPSFPVIPSISIPPIRPFPAISITP
jgi:hypothetical protein